MYGFVASEGVSECYGLVWCSKCPYLKISERQNSTHLTLLKHQNTKTSLYKLSKNHWVIALSKKIRSVRKILQSTVSLDHPVLSSLLNHHHHHHNHHHQHKYQHHFVTRTATNHLTAALANRFPLLSNRSLWSNTCREQILSTWRTWNQLGMKGIC